MAFLREQLWAFVLVLSVVAGSLAYAFSSFVEKREDKDGGEPKRAFFKTAMFAGITGAVLLWVTRSESPSVVPFQEI